MSELFHSYIIGGARDEARKHVGELLAPYNELVLGNPNYVVSEHVSFSIDDARVLRAWQELSAGNAGRKIYIAYTDFITREAENALLKTLEEPSVDTHIILAIPNPDVLLDTLRSRVRVIYLNSEEKNTSQAEKFLKMSTAERVAFVSKMIEKSDNEDASAEVRERAISFLNELETFYAEKIKKVSSEEQILLAEKIHTLLRFKKYLYISGSSVRMILETLAY